MPSILLELSFLPSSEYLFVRLVKIHKIQRWGFYPLALPLENGTLGLQNTRQVFEKTDEAISVLLAINPSVESLFVSAFEKNRVFRSLMSRMERQLLLPLASPTF